MRFSLAALLIFGGLLLIGGAQAAPEIRVVTWPDEGTTGACDASCTLEDAIADANNRDTIYFQANVTEINRTSTLTVNKDVTIDGNDTVTIRKATGAGTFSGITVDASVVLEDLVVRDFTGVNGGGVNVNSGKSFVNNATVANNTATSSGGGIYAISSTVTNNGDITNNTANSGGGILASVVSTVTNNGNITDNTATSDGGGIWASRGGTVTNNGDITGNTASRNGGGTYTVGGSFNAFTFVTFPRSDIQNSGNITGNTAANGGGAYAGAGSGGQPGSTLTNTGLINGNTATTSGGGVWATKTILSTGPLNGNTAPSEANLKLNKNTQLTMTGGNSLTVATPPTLTATTTYQIEIYRGTNCVTGAGNTGGSQLIATAQVTTDGSGAFSHEFTGLMEGYYVSQLHELSGANVADSHVYSQCAFVKSPAQTAPFSVNWPDPGTSPFGCTLGSCTLEDAIADASNGDTIYFAGNITTIDRTSTLTVDKDVTIDGNDAVTIRKASGAGTFVGISVAADVVFEDLVVRDFTGSSEGGGIQVGPGKSLVNNATVTNNTAINGGGIYTFLGGRVTNNGDITDNSATTNGGGIYATSSSTVTNNGNITGNNATSLTGGAIFATSSTVTNNGNITGNNANNVGGIYATSSSTVTNNGNITGNTATSLSGGIYVSSSSTVTNNGNITGNSATSNHAGGIYAISSTVTNNGNITGNTATSNGGGIYAHSSTVTNNGDINRNNATGNGGGVYAFSSSTVTNNGTITGNNATTGGGIHTDGPVTLSRGIVHANTAPTDANLKLTATKQLNVTGGQQTLTTNTTGLTASTDYIIELYTGADCSPGGVGETGGSKFITNATVTTDASGNVTHTFTGLATGSYVTQLHELSGGSIWNSHVYSECAAVTAAPASTGSSGGGGSSAYSRMTTNLASANHHEKSYGAKHPLVSVALDYRDSTSVKVTAQRYRDTEDLPPLPDGYLRTPFGVDLSISPAPDGGAVTFRVPASALEGLDLDRVVVMHHDGSWDEIKVIVVEQPDGSFHVTMRLEGLSFSPFLLAVAPVVVEDVSEPSAPVDEVDSGSEGDVSIETQPSPGFPLIGAILAIGVLCRRRFH